MKIKIQILVLCLIQSTPAVCAHPVGLGLYKHSEHRQHFDYAT